MEHPNMKLISFSEVQKLPNGTKVGCSCCLGDESVYWKDDENNAFVDSRGDMLVTVKGKTMRFKVKCCPNCGKKFE